MITFFFYSDPLNYLRSVCTVGIRTKNGWNSIKVISTKEIFAASSQFRYFDVFLVRLRLGISSLSKNINNRARVSRLSFRFLWLWFNKGLNKNKGNDKRFNNRGYSLFFWMGIFLKHLWLIPNMLKWQDSKIFIKLVVSKIFTKPVAATGGVLWKKVFLKICEVSKENTCIWASF